MALSELPDKFRLKFLTAMQDVGSTVILKKTDTTYDISTGKNVTTTSNTTYKCDISTYLSEEIKGAVLAGDIKVRFPNDNVINIDTSDIVLIDNLEYEIKNIMPYLKNDIKVYFDVQVRR